MQDPGSAIGQKRDRDGEAGDGGGSPGGTPTGTPGLAPQKKPRLTFGGGLRAISASQALEKRSTSSPAASSSASSAYPRGVDATLGRTGEGEMLSPLGGPDTELEEGPPLSLGASALEGENKPDKPKLVFPAAANVTTPGGEDRPKPRLTFGGGLAGVATGASSLAAGRTEVEEAAKPRLTFGGGLSGAPGGVSSIGLRWPASAGSTTISAIASVIPSARTHMAQASPFLMGPAPGYYGGGALQSHATAPWAEGMLGANRMASSLAASMASPNFMVSSTLAASIASSISSRRNTGVVPGLSPCTPATTAAQGIAASTGAVHLEALSDSDGEGDRPIAASPRGAPAATLPSTSAPDCASTLNGLLRKVPPPLTAPFPVAMSGAAVSSSGIVTRGGGGMQGVVAGVVGGELVAEGGETKTVVEEVMLTSGELLNKIQTLDESIAATDSSIAALQADALHGEGAIFGMQVVHIYMHFCIYIYVYTFY